MIAHARRSAPLECCGLLVGTPERIDESVATRNVASHPSRYRIDPEAHIELNRRLRGTGRAVVGAYHSHPSSAAEPSARDVDEAYYPEFVYVIVSLADPDAPRVGAYRIIRGSVSVVALEPHRGAERAGGGT